MKSSTSALIMHTLWLPLAVFAFVKGREDWGFFAMGAASLMFATHAICKAIEAKPRG